MANRQLDPAHIETDRMLAEIEKRIAVEFEKATTEMQEKLRRYMMSLEKKADTWQRALNNGTMSKDEYRRRMIGGLIQGKRWDSLKDGLADDYVRAAEIARAIVVNYIPDVYAENYAYGTYDVERLTGLDTWFVPSSVIRIIRDNPKIFHDPGRAVAKDIRDGKQKAWDKQRIQSVMIQGVVQGESIPHLVKRLQRVTDGDYAASVRDARTMMTGVQAAGRLDAFERADRMGIQTEKTWLANLDGRTRHWHRELDGVTVPLDEEFENSVGPIMFPGDPDADGANIYNCRCSLTASIKGFEIDYTDLGLRYTDKLGNMTYEEWKKDRNTRNAHIRAGKAGRITTTHLQGVLS